MISDLSVASRAVRLGTAAVALALTPLVAGSQSAPPPRVAPAESVAVAASKKYDVGRVRRYFFGENYRELWKTPVRVPVIDLETFDEGGLHPLKKGGSFQTTSLQLGTPDSVEYAFRFVDKDKQATSRPHFKGTIIEKVFRDQVSAVHPAAAVVASRLLEAGRVLHARPVLSVLPDDTLLGEFRAEFAGRLGMIEERPGTPEKGRGFAGAVDIIDSDDLLEKLNTDPRARVDARAVLGARLIDMMINDWDRHPGQWKWAKLQSNARAAWVPIPRDRDYAFVSFRGVLLRIARVGAPKLVLFTDKYASVKTYTLNSIELDRRLLGGLEKPVWDSVAAELVRRLDDSAIDAAVRAMPREYWSMAPQLAATLKLRRNQLPEVANRFYLMLARVADVHATDSAERAVVRRIDDRVVEVRLEAGDGVLAFQRRFDALETREIRVHLHGGDDTAVVTGNVGQSILVRIVGGNGTNRMVDSSTVGGRRDQARFYDVGRVDDVKYGKDTLFNRRPWVEKDGKLEPPGRDYGGRFSPVVGVGFGHDLGIVPKIGVHRYRYGFGRVPYSSLIGVEAEYATGTGGFRVGVIHDQRRELSPLHFLTLARMSDLEVVRFHGFGNDTPDAPEDGFDPFEVSQRQWMIHPAVGLAVGSRTDLTLGPLVQYSVTESTPNGFISELRPYGFGRFGQAGVRMGLDHDSRDVKKNPRRGLLADVSGSFYPGIWDVNEAYGEVGASARAYFTLPIPARPILAVRGGGKRVFGEFPFHDAAFLGGGKSVRTLHAQRLAGDASLFGTTELRIPVGNFPFILPLNVGVLGLLEAGRVFLDGESPGGWHSAAGVGTWVGILDPATGISVTLTTSRERRVLVGTGLRF